jgi:YD repeat-containing protein
VTDRRRSNAKLRRQRSPGDLTDATDPAGYVTDYTYDNYGDRTSVSTHPTPTVTMSLGLGLTRFR